MRMNRGESSSWSDSHAFEGIAVALTGWLAASALRPDLDLIWQSLSFLFSL
jgi:hypothetical protein